MKKMNKKIPNFKNEDAEREFWATHSPLEFFNTSSFKRASFPKLKPSLKSISIRLPVDMLAELKILANKKSKMAFLKIFLNRILQPVTRNFFLATDYCFPSAFNLSPSAFSLQPLTFYLNSTFAP